AAQGAAGIAFHVAADLRIALETAVYHLLVVQRGNRVLDFNVVVVQRRVQAGHRVRGEDHAEAVGVGNLRPQVQVAGGHPEDVPADVPVPRVVHVLALGRAGLVEIGRAHV